MSEVSTETAELLIEKTSIGETINVHQSINSDDDRKINTQSDYLFKAQRWHALWVSNLIPLAGFIAGVVLAFYWGVGWLEVGMLFVMYFLTIMGVEVGFHRFFSHKSFEASKTLTVILGALGSMVAQGPVIYWCANHRRHHKHADKKGDPHSPHAEGNQRYGGLKGLWYAHVVWQMHSKTPNSAYFTKDLLKIPLVRWINKTYFLWLILGVLLPAAVGFLITWDYKGAVIGFIWGGLGRLFLVNHFTYTVTSVCHVVGKQPFKTTEHSRNNWFLSIPTFGQAWHNNHHAFPYSAVVNFKWWQIDLGGMMIRIFKGLGMASNLKIPPQEMIYRKQQ
ncbi:MAG: fatty acid desaturase [Flavobacteriales bacterium]|nr:fatty acid desaturase [Flavobacteriales bacterium]